MLQKPSVLLLDEITAAVDVHSEAKIMDEIARLFPGVTTILSTHQLLSAPKADMIVVLYKSVVVEKGTRDQLMRQDGAYADMWRAQKAKLVAV